MKWALALLALFGLMKAGGASAMTTASAIKTQLATVSLSDLESTKLAWDKLYETGQINQADYSIGISQYLERAQGGDIIIQ